MIRFPGKIREILRTANVQSVPASQLSEHRNQQSHSDWNLQPGHDTIEAESLTMRTIMHIQFLERQNTTFHTAIG